MEAVVKIKNCFGCNKPVINPMYEPLSRRYYGRECIIKIIPNPLKCSGCNQWEEEIMEKESPSTGLRWVSDKLLCYVCYLGSDEYKEEKNKLQEKREQLKKGIQKKFMKKLKNFERENGFCPSKYW